MSSLPEEMQQEIFLRLPVKAICRFKSLCKTWCNRFGNPFFVRMHRDHAIKKNNTSLMLHYMSGIHKDNPIYSIECDSLSSNLSSAAHSPLGEAVEMDYPNMPPDSFAILGSCDGFICLLDTTESTSENDICLWNPSTKEYKKIPVSPNSENTNTDEGLYGFGYDDKIDDFKLVRVAEICTPLSSSDTFHDGSAVEIYTLGSNSWRLCQSQAMPYYFPGGSGAIPGVIVNGALHWCAADRVEYCEVIISFDMTNETFKEVAILEGPMLHPIDSDSDFDNNNLAVLGGCICILHKTYGVSVDLWVMQEYGVKESWTKRFTITDESVTQTECLRVVCEFQKDAILFETDNGLVYYDPKPDRAMELRVPGAKTLLGAEKYVTTLASLDSGTFVKKPKTTSRAV